MALLLRLLIVILTAGDTVGYVGGVGSLLVMVMRVVLGGICAAVVRRCCWLLLTFSWSGVGVVFDVCGVGIGCAIGSVGGVEFGVGGDGSGVGVGDCC